MSLGFVIGVQVLALGVVLFFATPAIRRRLPGSEGLLLLGRTALIVTGVILLAIPFFGTATPLSNTPNPVQATAASIGAGEDLYQANCARCHGVDAQGGGPDANTTQVQPPSLKAHLSAHSDGDLFYFLTNGLPGGMPAWASQLSETDRWNVINYLRSINAPSTPAPTPSATAVIVPLGLPVVWIAIGGALLARLRPKRRDLTAASRPRLLGTRGRSR
jgi:mono/diheme cytochrome c family protein